MSKKIISIIMVSIIAIVSIAILNLSNSNGVTPLYIPKTGAGTPKLVYELGDKVLKKAESLPAEKMVYKFIVDDPESKAKKIAKIFNIDSDKIVYSKNEKIYKYANKDSNKKLLKWFSYEEETGHWDYQDIKEFEKSNINIPDNNKCLEIAKNFSKNKLNLSKSFSNIQVVEQTSGDKLTNDLKTIYKDVYFYPYINDIPVLGVSRLIISVGENGKIIGVSKYFKDYKEDRKLKLKSVSKAFDIVKKKEASMNIPQNAKKAKFNSIILGYYEDSGKISEQPHLQPVYVFKGVAKTDSGTEEFDAIVPAID